MTLQPRDPGETFTTDRLPPATSFVRQLEAEHGERFFLLSEVANLVGVQQQTLRRLIRHPDKKVNAPSFKGHQGKMPIYVFTQADVDEIKEYYSRRYEGFYANNSPRGRGRPKSKKSA